MKARDFSKNQMKKRLTGIGSKIADAVDMTEKMGKLGTVSNIKLTQAQNEVSELYISIDDDAKGNPTDDIEEKPETHPTKKETE